MRFPVVLFDLDGTVVDSGGIILASMRHATREVLGRDYADEDLMQAVGGPGLEAQMHAFAPDRVEELVHVYRAHNEPLHEDLRCCEGMDDVLVRLKDGGRHKPDPEPLLLTAERMHAVPSESAYVGDSPFDVRAAKAAGMFAVAVTWGRIHDRERLEREEPDAIVERAEELLGIL